MTPGAHAALEWVLDSRNSRKDAEMAFSRLAVKTDLSRACALSRTLLVFLIVAYG